MAVVTNYFTGVPDLQQFGDLPDSEDHIYPRGLVTYGATESITAKTGADVSVIRIIMDLPQNYAYSYFDAHLALYSSNATNIGNWDDLGSLVFAYSNPPSTVDAIGTIQSEGVRPYGDTAAGTALVYHGNQPYTRVFYNQQGSYSRVIAYLQDTVAAVTSTCSLTYQISFLMYDIRQAEKVVVNAPQPVVVR